ELVHHDGDLRRVGGKNVTQQRRFAAAERAGDQCDGRARSHGRITVHRSLIILYPFTFPIGVKRATGLLMPASSVAAITSSMSLPVHLRYGVPASRCCARRRKPCASPDLRRCGRTLVKKLHECGAESPVGSRTTCSVRISSLRNNRDLPANRAGRTPTRGPKF